MPRGRGGARQGTAGTAYGNRTDLNMPMSTVPNQEYGKAAMQERAQQAVPMAQSPVASMPMPAAAAPQMNLLPRPGELPHLGPTDRPNEPVTTGMSFGPGPGPEAMMQPSANVAAQLATASQMGNSSTLQGLAAMASMMGV